jgi:hypothetical protein
VASEEWRTFLKSIYDSRRPSALRATAREPLPERVRAAARLHLLDAIGVGLAAAASPIGLPYRKTFQLSTGGPATVFGQGGGASAADAALINGGSIHSLNMTTRTRHRSRTAARSSPRRARRARPPVDGDAARAYARLAY